MLSLLVTLTAIAAPPPHPASSILVPPEDEYLGALPSGATTWYTRRFPATGNTTLSWLQRLWAPERESNLLPRVGYELMTAAAARSWRVRQVSLSDYRLEGPDGAEAYWVTLQEYEIRNSKVVLCKAVVLTYYPGDLPSEL